MNVLAKKDTTDIVLRYINNWGKCTNHLGLGYIISYLLKNHINAYLYINKTDNMTIEDLARDLLRYRVAFIGFTVYDANYHMCLKSYEVLKISRIMRSK